MTEPAETFAQIVLSLTGSTVPAPTPPPVPEDGPRRPRPDASQGQRTEGPTADGTRAAFTTALQNAVATRADEVVWRTLHHSDPYTD